MRTPSVRAAGAALVAALSLSSLGLAEGDTTSTTPADYIAASDQLSQPAYSTVQEEVFVPMPDGEELYVEVTYPDPAEDPGPWPVIMEISPYHLAAGSREGTRIFPDAEGPGGQPIGLTGYFAPRGYAVAMVDLRGTGESTGCLDHLGPRDADDIRTVVEWAADAPWSDGKVGVTGHSYVGSTPSLAAAEAPRGLVTVVPSAGLASMYDHQFHNGVPYNLQWAGPMFAYELSAAEADVNTLSARPDETGCGMAQSSLTAGHGQVTGQYQNWHAERDWGDEAADADVPIFMIHGVNDNAARIPAAEWFFGDRAPNPDDKVWIGQWDHGSSGGSTRCHEARSSLGHVNCRFDQWKYALHAWFDKWLQGRDVETGPAVEAFLNDDVVHVADGWDRDGEPLTLYPDAADMSLGTERPAEEQTAAFTAIAGSGSAEFVSEPLGEDVVFLGLPRLQLNVDVATGEVVHLVPILYREDESGRRFKMNTCAANTHLRNDVATPAPVVPLREMAIDTQCFTMAHRVPAGQRLVLAVTTNDPDHHVPTLATETQITVHTGPNDTTYTLPTVPAPQLSCDVGRWEDRPDPRPCGLGGTTLPTRLR